MTYYDCFTFNNELDILEIRFKTLYDKVEKFILVESDKTHAGKSKPLHYLENESRFRPFMDKVIHVKAELPNHPDRWVLENLQRNFIMEGFAKLGVIDPGSMALISDADEIPDLTLHQFGGKTFGEGVFEQKHSMYFLDRVHPHVWNGTVAVYMGRFASPYGRITPQQCRNFRDVLSRIGPGWHFGWIGDYSYMRNKVESFGHSELDTDEYKDNTLKDIFNKRMSSDGRYELQHTNEYLPECCKDYPHLFDQGQTL